MKKLWICILAILAGSYICVRCILMYVCCNPAAFSIKESPERNNSFWFFVIPFAVISIVYILVWYFCYYPGLLSVDSID